jgi:hypothetical protein
VSAGLAVTLDGSGSSDPDGDQIALDWSLDAPSGSAAALDDPSSTTPAFMPDVPGGYVATLSVSDGTATTEASVTVTAEDATTATTVDAAAGGEARSSDGSFTLVVPAGALAEDTEIRITRAAPSQFPASTADVAGVAAAYDLQPSGLVFAVPAELHFTVDGAFEDTANGLEVDGALLYAESAGEIEVLGDITLVRDGADPTAGILTGAVSHFSSALVTRPQGLAFRIDGPGSWEAVAAVHADWNDYPVGTTFDGIVSVVTAGSPFPGFTAITQVDASVEPVVADPAFEAELVDEGGGIYTGVNAFICNQAGAGTLRARVRVDVADAYASVLTVQMARDVTCTAPAVPLAGTYLPAPLATRLVNWPGVEAMTLGGGGARTLALSTNTLEAYATADFDGDPSDWVNRMSDGSFLVHSRLGRPRWVDHLGDSIGGLVHAYDQPRDAYQPAPDVTLVASAFGDLGIMDYQPTGFFSDRRRTLDPVQSPGKQSNDQLIQVWGSPDGFTILGVRVEGGGDAAVERSSIQLFHGNPDGFGGLDGRVLTDFFDEPYRHELDLECIEDGAQELLCVFSAGNPAPAGNFGTAEDGYFVIFKVDLATESMFRLWRYIGGPARSGGSIYPSADGNAHVVAVVNQDTAELELYRVEGDEVVDDTSIQLDGGTRCVNPVDMAYNDLADRWVLICEGTPGDGRGLLVIEGLRGYVPGF